MNTILIIMMFTGGRFGNWTPVRAIEYPSWEACKAAEKDWKDSNERVVCAPVIKRVSQ
jgi:hypothetical protein